MFQLLRNWVRKIVIEEMVRQQYPLTDENLRKAYNTLIKDEEVMNHPYNQHLKGEIIKLNPVENYLKENSDKEVSIGEILQEE